MEGEVGLIGSIIDERHSLGIQGGQMESESGVTRGIIDDLYDSDIQGDQMEVENGVARSIFDELHYIISLSCHEQVCLNGLRFERYFSHHGAR